MPVYDLWISSKLGPNKEKVKTARYGRGKRWRAVFVHPGGVEETKAFHRKTDAEEWERQAIKGELPQSPKRVVLSATASTFAEYAERWRLAREMGWQIETRERVVSNLKVHLIPVFGGEALGDITETSVLEWLSALRRNGHARSSIKLYFELLDAICAAMVRDKKRDDNPCEGIRLAKTLGGMASAPKWVPTADQVWRMLDTMPPRYRAAGWLGAGEGLRFGEALGMEDGPRCIDPAEAELHVVQQLRYSPKEYGGFYLTEPKAGSSGTVDLDALVAEHVAWHVAEFPPVEINLPDITDDEMVRRTVPLLFTSRHGNPLTDRIWSREWGKWREAAGWPNIEHAGFHALRHFFATVLITNGAEPQEVQRALRHKSLSLTLGTYVGFWPKRIKARGIFGEALAAARRKRS
ncbi:tyrosine-type recombinase/integrase [Dactylosporangium sp. CS-033363]|uniref:tyrosine-type recombinase/integrase n=1 Tax=Dactylosporangium sp. CS-033363 TaxID=3239935 RepID=UPI003D8E330E